MRSVLLSMLVMATASASSVPSPPTTILIGQSWLGLWHAGKLISSHAEPGWQFNASRLTSDGRSVRIAVYRKGEGGGSSTVLLFDARTLALHGRANDPALTQDNVFAPLDTDISVPDATGPGGAIVATPVPEGRLLRLRGESGVAPAHRLPTGTWRVALSPDHSVAAAFGKPAVSGAPWRGQAWNTHTGRAIPAPGLFIDDGTKREDGARRGIACLLPRGEGAIFTYIGPPADNFSEYQPFAAHSVHVVELKGDYIMSCLAAR